MLPIGTKVRSTFTDKKEGSIVGYGSLSWPSSDPVRSGDEGVIQPVYLVQVASGSMYGVDACIVLRCDRVKEISS